MEPPHGRKPGRGLPRPHRRQPAGRRRWAWGALALTLAAGLAGAALLLRGRAVPPPWRLGSVTEGPVVAAIIASGTLNPVITVQVGSQVSGQILALSADFNSEVSKGELIARIDPSLFETQVKQAEADLGVARAAILVQRAGVTKAGADLGVARATLDSLRQQTRRAQVAAEDAGRIADRRQKLYATGSGTLADRDTAQANFDGLVAQQHAAEAQEVAQRAGIDSQAAALQTAEANLAMAEAQVGQKQAVLDNARVNLDHTYITRPGRRHGHPAQRRCRPDRRGQPAGAGALHDRPGPAGDAGRCHGRRGRYRRGAGGQLVEFGVDAYPGRVFRGAVIQVRKAPQAVQNVVTYDAVIYAANPDLALMPGHDRDGPHHHRAARQSVLGAERGAALPADGDAAGAGRRWGRARARARGTARRAAARRAAHRHRRPAIPRCWRKAPQTGPGGDHGTHGRRRRAPPSMSAMRQAGGGTPGGSGSSRRSYLVKAYRLGPQVPLRSAASRSTSPRASSSPSWAPRAPASRPS